MRNMSLFLFGSFTSLFGSGLLIIALPIYILNESSSGASLGLFMALTVLPSLFLTPFWGNYLERLNRKYIMIIMDIIHFFSYFVLAYFDNLSMIQLGAFICVSMIVDKIFNISSTSIFSQIIEIGLVEKGNSFKSILDNIAQIISPLAGTMLYMTFGLKGIFYINSITFLISAISEIFIVYNYEKIESNKKKIFENMSEIYHLILKNLTLKKLFITKSA